MSPSLADLRETSEAQLFAGRRGELAVLSELPTPDQRSGSPSCTGRAAAARACCFPNWAAALVDWGRGEPLPIALACEAAKRDPDFRPEGLDADETLAERLIRQVCDGELDGQGGEVVLAAAVARFVDAPLLEEVADVPDGAAAERWLGRLSFGERIGGRLTLHERVRRALRTHAQSLRRRVADALDLAFGSSTRDQLLRQTLERGYLDPDGNHARAALDLHLSRSTYFRRLREATARLAAARLLR